MLKGQKKMPTNYIKKLSKQGKGSISALEKKWELAEAKAKAEGHESDYGYITTIFKSMVHIKASLNMDDESLVNNHEFYTVHAGSTLVMNPSMFLNLTKPFDLTGEKSLNQERVDYYIKNPHWLTNPMLVISNNKQGRLQVVNQDGRHRSLAALQTDIKLIKVDVFMTIGLHKLNPKLTNANLAQLIENSQVIVSYSNNF